MTYFSHIRAGLISTALLLTTALASPAFAESLPEISPRQIASDVEVRYNPQSGVKEYIAPSFDPFEEDRSMAGTASLRSVSNATTIDGQSVRGGALLDMTFYYNSASNDPYDTRGYEDAVYLSGEYAPVTLRNNRILECNEQVQDVVYYHEDYYRPSLYVNLFRPYRHYRGHYRYDRFGDRGFGRAYGYSRGYRGYRGRNGYRGRLDRHDRRSNRNRRGSTTDQIIDRSVDRARRTVTQREERAATGRRMDRTPSARRDSRNENRRETRRNPSRDRIDTRFGGRDGFLGGPRRFGSNSGAAGRRSTSSSAPAPRATTSRASTPRVRNESLAGASARRAAPREDRAVRRERAPRAIPRQAAPRAAAPAPRAQRAAPAPRPQRAAPAPRPQRAERSRPARLDRAVRRAREIKSSNAPRRGLGRKGAKLKMMGFLPMASSWSRNVVRNVDTQCAREEMLTVHIPQDRLDASRFDGLTVLVLDRTGQEIPVYVPPNYIEGFRQAVSGRVTPDVSYQAPRQTSPVTREPIYQEQRPYSIESAPCPAGTTKQNDGTCLQGGSVTLGGYPTR
ncbi:hypothetical protein [Hellea balneolensis]|uniref:hypothetical protein n=1 Tax=Hellea balneolensis TaxID=287478 RepID=UPI000416673B|nr:hypothetical protein [Hellea balneolensis]